MSKLSIVAAMLTVALLHGPAQAEWKKYESAHFTIYTEAGEKQATELAEGLERTDALMRKVTGFAAEGSGVKVRIYQVASVVDVSNALGPDTSGVAGFYDNNIFGPFAVTPRKTYSSDALFTPDLVLHHEYAHHFMLQYFPAIYPAWYVEGFAELIGSSTAMADGRIAYGMPAHHRTINFEWVPLEYLLTKPPEQLHHFDLYSQGWALTHFFTFSKAHAPQLRQYLAALSAGKSPAEAAKAAFENLGPVDHEARAYVDKGSFPFTAVEVPIARPVIQKVEGVGAGEAALIPEIIAFRDTELSEFRERLDRLRERKLREENLARIRKKAALFPADPFALHTLAMAEYMGGDCTAAEAAADRLLAVEPSHVRGMVVKSLCFSRNAASLSGSDRTARAQQARSLALKANHADPNDPLPLVAYYESFHSAGLTPPPDAVNSLAAASATLPHDTRLRQLLVDELAAEHRWAEAIATLMPIANDTHQSPRREAARAQLTTIQAEFAKQDRKGS